MEAGCCFCCRLLFARPGLLLQKTPPGMPIPWPPQTLVDKERRTYATSSEMSIEFEVDGPYKVRALGCSWRDASLGAVA